MTWNLRSFHLFSFHKRQKTFYPVCSRSLYPAQLGRQSSLGWVKAFFASFVFHSHVIFVLICPRLLLSCGAMRGDSHQERGEGGVRALRACPLRGGNSYLRRALGCPVGRDEAHVGRWLVSAFQVAIQGYFGRWPSLSQFKKNPLGPPRRL